MNRSTMATVLATLVIAAACAQGAEEEEVAPPQEAPVQVTDTPAAPPAEGALLDPNRASAEDLAVVPALGDELARALVDGRPYADMRAVDAVLSGRLGEEERDSVYSRVWLPIDLNTASRAEILLIPGVGERMAHEFEEYRPYRAIAEFRREIGKYVDAEEVARLERYVEVR